MSHIARVVMMRGVVGGANSIKIMHFLRSSSVKSFISLGFLSCCLLIRMGEREDYRFGAFRL
jgi:hypothetical protein